MKFFKIFFAALLAFVTANVVILLVILAVIGGIIAGSTGSTDGSILRIDFADGVSDAPSGVLFTRDLEVDRSVSLWEVVRAIEFAATDPQIETIYINVTGGAVSLSGLEEVRGALERLRETSGKRIVAWADSYSQPAYYLASVADEVYVHPEGGVAWQGVAAQTTFYKGLMDKLGVEVEVFRHGEFKSAVEPFVQRAMSEASRRQMEALTGSVWRTVREQVARSRSLSADTLSDYAANLRVESAEDAVELGLVDEARYEDMAVEGEIVELNDYIAGLRARKIKDEIAIVYLDGEIVDGQTEVCEQLERVRDDDDVRGVVLRVNSPGGSALAADVIWREVKLLREKKPVIVSMGSMAASGGYYVAAPADMILTNETTITGSIGVFGMLPNVGGALEDKLGITTEVVRSEPHADMGSVMRAADDTERAHLRRGIERVYKTFVGHVAAGRNMTFEEVDSLAGGRVWSGVDAVECGLADGVGGLWDAVAICADRAGVADYAVTEAVEPRDMLSMVVRSVAMVKNFELPFEEVLKQKGMQARLPYNIEIGYE